MDEVNGEVGPSSSPERRLVCATDQLISDFQTETDELDFVGQFHSKESMIEHLFQVVPIFLPQNAQRNQHKTSIEDLSPKELSTYRRLFDECVCARCFL